MINPQILQPPSCDIEDLLLMMRVLDDRVAAHGHDAARDGPHPVPPSSGKIV